MYANKPCATPFFYTPAPGLSFDNKGYLSAVNDWKTSTGTRCSGSPPPYPPPCTPSCSPPYLPRNLPRWPVACAKIYPVVDNTSDYFVAFPSNVPDINQMTDTTENWPSRACRLS